MKISQFQWKYLSKTEQPNSDYMSSMVCFPSDNFLSIFLENDNPNTPVKGSNPWHLVKKIE